MPLQLDDGREVPDSERTRCEIYDRVVGYYRPRDQWNLGKQAEARDRKRYAEPPQTELQRRLFE